MAVASTEALPTATDIAGEPSSLELRNRLRASASTAAPHNRSQRRSSRQASQTSWLNAKLGLGYISTAIKNAKNTEWSNQGAAADAVVASGNLPGVWKHIQLRSD
ncbi:hypothetical protein F443_20498 [Phytophthora nicotianae P1569]|uniref:Uncharacterized protein n=1 Tax=Phytophthora nicotianae P1569 TaxID=1317065 RepID=V9E1A9_PHYNI|nr:hypothetical protein F443_20498 [Phytophthora nicotianae P1569]